MNVSNTYPTGPLQALDAAHHMHPFSDMKALNAEGSRIIVKGKGCWLEDSNGKRILDGMAGLWCVNIGHGRPEIAEAVQAQMAELSYYNTFFKTTHPPVIELSRMLAELAPPSFNHVFFTGSGSESNDTMLRMVRTYWKTLEKPEKFVVIARKNAYHGSTMAGASLGGMAPMHAQGGLPIPGIHHIAQPYWFDEGGELSPEEFGLQTARALEQAIDEIGEDNVAAFIAEPVQGAGGVIVPPATYWPEIQRICKERNILLVADEVITGFGRLGRWFGSEYFGIEPDLMPIAKGLSSGYLPIGGVMVGDRVADVIINQTGDFNHGFTYSGHPVACAAAIANLKILRDEKIIERVANDTGPYLQKKWALLANHPLVGEARMVGMMGALELVPAKPERRRFAGEAGKIGTICRDFSFKNGLIMRAVRDSMILSPPLVISHEEIDELIRLATKTLDDTHEELLRQGLMG
ncbi:Omega-amino acid-pyruvate aminotransferase [Hartmannibacter diazotrophicus]|uniref:Omega-amino acid-pyruvate aminotransferase n=1 Tax=Hartmannibacter diazotrophicus TaxID=1482074 RepID=A0A2C9D2L9_9HYPH|nr:aspartate aminotransferase family protein [Hartmannibacter diazotrophicus]SON54473.1 Omega-amino acid-pyruvate aminotransferase [Hartmannibacter diazotrophicus]